MILKFGIFMIIALFISVILMISDLKYYISKIDGFERPSLNRNINYTIFGICLCSFLIGSILALIIF